MRIQGTGTGIGLEGGIGIMQGSDARTKELQNQIAKAKERLQELSAEDQMSAEEKMKKRQEIQKEITELNNQLRQHQIDLRREKQQAAASSSNQMDELSGAAGNTTGSKKAGMSKAGMKAMVSADAALDQAREQGATATRLEGRAGVLDAEIRQDKSLGVDTADKEEELAQVQEGAANATASQIEVLGKAGQEMKEAAKTEESGETSDEKEKTSHEKVKKAEDGRENKNSQESERVKKDTAALPGENVDLRL